MRPNLVALLPLDDRPCNALFPEFLAQIAGVDLRLIVDLSRIKKEVQICDAAIFSIDRFVYGGLVESRLFRINKKKAQARMKSLESLLRGFSRSACAFTVLMRQAPSAFTAEEAKRAELIQQASLHFENKNLFGKIVDGIPEKNWEEYLAARKRNLEVNLSAIRLLEKKSLNFLAVTLDDHSRGGMNQKEEKVIRQFVKTRKLSRRVAILPGSDEMGMLLFTRELLKGARPRPKIFPIYSHPNPDRFTLRYEACSLSEIVERQIRMLGAALVSNAESADLLLFIHSPHEDQEDIPSNPVPRINELWVRHLRDAIRKGQASLLADLRFANGADAALMRFLAQRIDLTRLFSYCGWNTAANALGISLAHAATRWLSLREKQYQEKCEEAHRKFLLLRFLEDWFYQSEIRPALLERLRRERRSTFRLSPSLIRTLGPEIKERLGVLSEKYLERFPSLQVKNVTFPWSRLFEIHIEFSV